MRKICTYIGVAAVVCLFAPRAQAGLVTNISYPASIGISVQADDAAVAGDDSDAAFPSIPTNTSVNATQGGSSSSSTFDVINTPNTTVISTAFDHANAASTGSFVKSRNAIRFTVDSQGAPVMYDLSGLYQLTGQNQQLTLIVSIADVTPPTNIEMNKRFFQSMNATNETFTLDGGDLQADSVNTVVGSLTGDLMDGHTYQLYIAAIVKNASGAPVSSVTANGSVDLTLLTVPSPTSAWLVMAGLGLLASSRRGRIAA